jgi:hypothetical protein
MTDKLLAAGPKLASRPICLGCNKTLIEPNPWTDFYKCSKCTWPLCGEKCENSTAHVDECKVMSAKNFFCTIENSGDVNKIESAYCVILPMRVLLLKKKSPEVYVGF